MRILFVGVLFDRSKEKEYLSMSKRGIPAAANEFQWNVCDGLIEHTEHEMDILTAIPVGYFPSKYKRGYLKKREWTYCGKRVKEIASINLPLIKQLQRKWNCYREVKKWIEEKPDENNLIIVYSLYLPYLEAISKLIREYKYVQATLIITDLPGMYGILPENQIKALVATISGNRAMNVARRFHTYVLLTEEMKTPLKIQNRPFVLIEGICKSSNSNGHPKNKNQNDGKKYILYTGTLHRIYGILDLVDAFEKITNDDCELWICGTGDAEDDIRKRSNPRIKLLGFCLKEQVLEMQRNAQILVNPRTSKGEYTKYSFPSKTIEYMESGVPVVMRRLPGIPDEYARYLVFTEDDSVEALQKCLAEVLKWSDRKREEYGLKAKEFVQRQKSPYKQTDKLILMAERKFADSGIDQK